MFVYVHMLPFCCSTFKLSHKKSHLKLHPASHLERSVRLRNLLAVTCRHPAIDCSSKVENSIILGCCILYNRQSTYHLHGETPERSRGGAEGTQRHKGKHGW